MSTHALASITATYTDSEPEGDDASEPEDETKPEPEPESEEEEPQKDEPESQDDSVSSTTVTLTQEVSFHVTKLVSYNDDAYISDDELDYINYKIDSELGDVELPPEPIGRCSPRLLDKVAKLHEKVSGGLDINNMIQSKKEFRNPSIYEKLIQFCGINELGTNYSTDVYDPSKWGKESYYEELAKAQKIEMDKREKEKKERTKVEFVSGTKKPSGNSNDEEQKKRKSKWDQVGAAPGGGAGISLGLIRPAGLLQATLTASITGTKGTLIPAFGSLPKRPRL